MQPSMSQACVALPATSAGESGSELTVLVCGIQPPPADSPLAQLLESLSAAGIEPVTVWDGSLQALDGLPGVRVVGLLSSAAHALAQALHLGLGEPDAVLSAWILTTRQVLRAAHERPGSWRLFDAEEVERSPQLLAEDLADWGIDWQPPAPSSDLPSSLLTLELADAVVRARPMVRQLQSEVAASCIPLEAIAAAGANPVAGRADAARLWHEHALGWLRFNEQKAHLEAKRRALESANEAQRTEIGSLRDRLRLAQTALEAANGRCSDLEQQQAQAHREVEAHRQDLAAMTALMLEKRAESQAAALETAAREDTQAQALLSEAAAQQDLRAGVAAAKAVELGLQQELVALRQVQLELKRATELARAESALLLAQLKTIQEQMVSERQTSHQLRRALAKEREVSAEALRHEARTRDTIEQRAEQLRVERDSIQTSIQQMQGRIEQAGDQLRVETERSQTLGQRLKEEQSQRMAVDSKLKTAQSELEQTSAEHRLLLMHLHQLQESLEAQALRSDQESCEALTFAAEQLQRPHRHLDLALGGVTLGQQTWPRVDLRLVDHSGRAGVLFWDDGEPRVLRAWRANGEEGGRKFLLLMPGDPAGRLVLNALGTQDWNNLLGVARLLTRLLASEEPQAARWQVQAQQLLRALTSLSPRLRYDERRLQPTSVDSVEAVLVNTSFGERQLGDVELRWLPQADRLLWLAPTDTNQVPMSGWPINTEGVPEPNFEVPVGAVEPSSARRGRWAAMLDSDQMLLLAVLDTLAGAAREFAVTSPMAAATQAGLVSQSARWRRQAAQALRASRLRARLRQLLGRGRH
jgi:hypothetical protein